jgi:hypothetical protein
LTLGFRAALRALVHHHFCPRAQLNNGYLVALLLHRNVAVRADDLQRWDTRYNHGFVTQRRRPTEIPLRSQLS